MCSYCFNDEDASKDCKLMKIQRQFISSEHSSNCSNYQTPIKSKELKNKKKLKKEKIKSKSERLLNESGVDQDPQTDSAYPCSKTGSKMTKHTYDERSSLKWSKPKHGQSETDTKHPQSHTVHAHSNNKTKRTRRASNSPSNNESAKYFRSIKVGESSIVHKKRKASLPAESKGVISNGRSQTDESWCLSRETSRSFASHLKEMSCSIVPTLNEEIGSSSGQDIYTYSRVKAQQQPCPIEDEKLISEEPYPCVTASETGRLLELPKKEAPVTFEGSKLQHKSSTDIPDPVPLPPLETSTSLTKGDGSINTSGCGNYSDLVSPKSERLMTVGDPPRAESGRLLVTAVGEGHGEPHPLKLLKKKNTSTLSNVKIRKVLFSCSSV